MVIKLVIKIFSKFLELDKIHSGSTKGAASVARAKFLLDGLRIKFDFFSNKYAHFMNIPFLSSTPSAILLFLDSYEMKHPVPTLLHIEKTEIYFLRKNRDDKIKKTRLIDH